MLGDEPLIWPKFIGGRAAGPEGAPFCRYPLLAPGLIVSDEFRMWSPGVGDPLAMLALLTMAGACATEGTAGGAAGLPFTGEAVLLCGACRLDSRPPTTRGPLEGGEGFPFVAFA